MDQNQFPKGWNAKRVQQVISHYQGQSEDEAAMEDEAAWNSQEHTVMLVPIELVETVRELIAKHQAS